MQTVPASSSRTTCPIGGASRMYRLPSMTAFAVMLLAGIAPLAATAADSAADSKYTYRPYGQQNQAGSDAANSPANNAEPAAAEPNDAGPGPGDTEDRGYDGAYRDDARRAPGPNQGPESEQDDIDERAEGPVPPPAAGQVPPRGFAETRQIEATASAPDRSVPYSVREQDARRAAIEAWRSKAAERFGPEFSHWRMAERRHVDCVRDRGDDAVCTVSGVPVRGDARSDRPYRDDRY
jgi:hypothetical protein